MRVLLDTHALLWALRDDPRLSRRATEVIGDRATAKLVSVVSGYEVCLKHNLGKLPEGARLAADFAGEIDYLDSRILPLTLAHALAAGKLDLRHRDPFDRLLIAQALIEQAPIVSNDAAFDGYGVERIW